MTTVKEGKEKVGIIRSIAFLVVVLSLPFWMFGYRLMGIGSSFKWGDFDVTPDREVSFEQYMLAHLAPLCILLLIGVLLAVYKGVI